MTEADIKERIFERYPDLVNVRPLAWSGGVEVPSNRCIGIAVYSRARFDGWHHLPVRDDALRDLAWAFFRVRNLDDGRCCYDADAILCLVRVQ